MAGSRAHNRRATVWGLVAEQAARRGEPISVTDVCTAAVAAVAVSGAALTARRRETGHVICVTDELSAQIEEFQMTLGEGPCVDAAVSSGPVLTPDLGTREAGRRWPGFASLASRAGVGALFAFPLQIGAIRIGVLDLHRRQPGPLTADELGDALVFADTATLLLLDAQNRAAGTFTAATGPGGQPAELAMHRAEIDQATGMLTEQLGTDIEDAFVRLRAYAYAHDQRLTDVARDIVDRRLRLAADPIASGDSDE